METDESPAVWTTKRETWLRFKGNHLKKPKYHSDNSVLGSTTNNQRETNRSLITDWWDFNTHPRKREETWNWQEVSVSDQQRNKLFGSWIQTSTIRMRWDKKAEDGLMVPTSSLDTFSTHTDTLRHTPTHTDTLRHTPTHTDTLRHTSIRLQLKVNLMTGAATINQNFTGRDKVSHWLYSLRRASV